MKENSNIPKRTKDKVALVAFAPTTRDLAPWDDPDYEIWILNEGYNFPWVKRFDRLFQIHPRWDVFRLDNANDPNHGLWLQNKSGPCVNCKGTGKLSQGACGRCVDGVYTPPANRSSVKSIFMQKQWDDIPNSVEFPLNEVTNLLPLNGQKYFASSFAYMLSLAFLMGFPRVEIYGFEMGTNTEYSYQRPNAEYLMGLYQGKGLDIYLPKESTLRKSLLYGYQNMRTGYRQQLDMRVAVLDLQLKKEQQILDNLTGQVQLAATIENMDPAKRDELSATYGKQMGLVNVVRGAKLETENLTRLYDTYFIDNDDIEFDPSLIREDTKKHVETTYSAG